MNMHSVGYSLVLLYGNVAVFGWGHPSQLRVFLCTCACMFSLCFVPLINHIFILPPVFSLPLLPSRATSGMRSTCGWVGFHCLLLSEQRRSRALGAQRLLMRHGLLCVCPRQNRGTVPRCCSWSRPGSAWRPARLQHLWKDLVQLSVKSQCLLLHAVL